jgi:uncharacterized membrane protein YdjX (TVP38/TMEM64 family)
VTELPPTTPKPKWRGPALIGFALILLAVFWFGRQSVNVDVDLAAGLMQSMDPRLAWPLTLLIFTAASFLGVPQWALIGGAVIAFGPGIGAALSWGGTMISSTLNFLAGRILGGERLKSRLSARGQRWMDRLSRNGLMASFLVRLVPVAPYFIVNMAAGASTVRWRDFAGGTALGIIPKIAIIALFGKGIGEFLAGQDLWLSILAIAAAIGLAILLWLWQRRIREHIPPSNPPATLLNREKGHQNTPKSETKP